MKNLKNKLTVEVLTVEGILLNSLQINAQGEGVDESGLKNWANSYLQPICNVLMWAIPIAYVIYVVWKGVNYMKAEATGEQQPPFLSTLTKGTVVAVVAASVNTLVKIFAIK